MNTADLMVDASGVEIGALDQRRSRRPVSGLVNHVFRLLDIADLPPRVAAGVGDPRSDVHWTCIRGALGAGRVGLQFSVQR